MNSEDLDYKIRKYTIKLRNADSKRKAHHYQRKLQQYHQINQFGGFINDDDKIMKNLKTSIDKAFEESKKDPELFTEFSKVINDNSTRIKELSNSIIGGNISSPSETLINTVQQFFEKSDNLKDIDNNNSDQGTIY